MAKRVAYIVTAYSKQGGPLFRYTGERFSDNENPLYFTSHEKATKAAVYLTAHNEALKRNYIVGTRRINPLPLLTLLGNTSTVKTVHDTIVSKSKHGKVRRRNPSERDEIRQSARLLKDFSGHDPTEVLRVAERPFKAGLVIGTLDAVPYTAIRDGKRERYLHEFERNARPLLVASSDGRSLRIVGGRFRFTEAGIIDDA